LGVGGLAGKIEGAGALAPRHITAGARLRAIRPFAATRRQLWGQGSR